MRRRSTDQPAPPCSSPTQSVSTGDKTFRVSGNGKDQNVTAAKMDVTDGGLTFKDSKGNVVATNTGWTSNTSPSTISSAAQQVGAFALPNPSADSALLLSLQPGAYTAQITSAKGNSGTALFEAYTN